MLADGSADCSLRLIHRTQQSLERGFAHNAGEKDKAVPNNYISGKGKSKIPLRILKHANNRRRSDISMLHPHYPLGRRPCLGLSSCRNRRIITH